MPTSPTPAPLLWQTTEQTQLFQTPLTPDLVAWRLEAQKTVRTPDGEKTLNPLRAEGIAHREDLRAWAQHGQGVPQARAHWAWLSSEAQEGIRHHYFGDDELRPLWNQLRDQQPWTMLRDADGQWPGRLCVIEFGSHEVRDALTNQRLPKATELSKIYLHWCERDMDIEAFRAHMQGRMDIRWTPPRYTTPLPPGQVPEAARNPWDDSGEESAGGHLSGTWIPSDEAWALLEEGLAILVEADQSSERLGRHYEEDRRLRVFDVFGADQFLKPAVRGENVLAERRTNRDAPLSDDQYARVLAIRQQLAQLPVQRTPLIAPSFVPGDAPSAPPKRPRRR